MRWFLVVALALAGCDAVVLPWDQPMILIDPKAETRCSLDSTSGLFQYDPNVGVTAGGTPLMWPQGYTARRVGSEVGVYDKRGQLRVTTGENHAIAGAWYNLNPPVRGLSRVFLVC